MGLRGEGDCGERVIVVLGLDYFRVELLEKARAAHPHGLLVCEACGWVWLTMDDAKINHSSDGLGVCCRNEIDCYRRRVDRVGPPSPGWEVEPSKKKRKRRRID